MKKLSPTSKIDSFTLLCSLSMLGDRAFWPSILLGNAEFEMHLIAYDSIYSKVPETEEELLTEPVKEAHQRLIERLRCVLQSQFDALVAFGTLENPLETDVTQYNKYVKPNLEKTKAAKTFLKNNSVDYGSETVAQIAERLNISKSEVRRRKQNNEL